MQSIADKTTQNRFRYVASNQNQWINAGNCQSVMRSLRTPQQPNFDGFLPLLRMSRYLSACVTFPVLSLYMEVNGLHAPKSAR